MHHNIKTQRQVIKPLKAWCISNIWENSCISNIWENSNKTLHSRN